MNERNNTLAMITVHIANIFNWGVARNITIAGGASMNAQLRKGAQEVVETAIAYGASDSDGILDGVGDMIVCIAQAVRIGGGSVEGFMTTFRQLLVERDERCGQKGITSAPKSLELIADACVANSPTKALTYIMDFVIALTLFGAFNNYFVEDLLEQALAKAWNDIKDRKGTMINGQFVKE